MDEKNTPAANESFFDGGLLQLLGWKIVGALISAVTLGICVPWAVCMIENWKQNTLLSTAEDLCLTAPDYSCSVTISNGFYSPLSQ